MFSSFQVAIIGLAIFKYILFGILFALSAGKLKFWIFPNLTEDVGFLESFLPIYDYTYTGASFRRKKDKVLIFLMISGAYTRVFRSQ